MKLLLILLGFIFLAGGLYTTLSVVTTSSSLTRDQCTLLQVIARLLFAIICILLAIVVFLLSCWI